MVAVLAHESWFVDAPKRFPIELDRLGDVATVVAVVGALGACLVFWYADRRWGEPRLRRLDVLVRIRPWLPRLLGLHAGFALLGTALDGGYLAPSMRLGDGRVAAALAVVEVVTAAMLITGYRRHSAAALLVAAGVLGLPFYGVIPVLERADLLGAAVYLAFARGRGATPEERAEVNPAAATAMRVLTGLALILLAFTEKLLNPGLARAFLDEEPTFDIYAALGVFTTDQFIWTAAAIELTLGALLVLGRLPRLVVVLVGVPFNATLPLLGWRELVGHLPVYGVLLVVLVEAQTRRFRDDPATRPRGPHAGDEPVEGSGIVSDGGFA
ncbi:MAG TPA: hypothetical protein VNA14_11110 [Mycobacteriales bacterium]|nr:hypothetical protein [Mycobacteriales bacterium]